MTSLLRYLTRRSWRFVLVSAGILGAFEYLVCAIVTTVDLSGAIQEVLKSAPPFFSAMLGEQFAGLTLRGILAFGWNHPVAHAAGAAVAIVLGARAFAGEVEQGAIELLMTQPVSRASYYSANLLFGIVSLWLLTLVGVGAMFLGQRVFDVATFTAPELLTLGFNFWLLQLAWYTLTLAFSAFAREGGRVASIAFFVALLSYLVRAIGTVWDPAAVALPYSLYSYYSPQEILVEQTLKASSLVVLAIVAVAGAVVAAWQFARRDLP
jgi:ABC-type transport system involved in multi-copper enzyme maturation permease subunit